MGAQATEEQTKAEDGGVGEWKARRGSREHMPSTLGSGWEAILTGGAVAPRSALSTAPEAPSQVSVRT